MTEFKPNTGQRRAIEFGIDAPLKVVAGAGTGKTAVLTQRFVHIVEKHDIQPFRILALTFTKKAASEMQRRITSALLSKGLIAISEVPLLLWIGNFHSFCLRLLKQNALIAGLDPGFGVLDETEQRLILTDIVNDFMNKRLGTAANPDSFEELMIERGDEFASRILVMINHIKSQFIGTEELKETLNKRLTDQYLKIEANLIETAENEELHQNTRKKAEERLEHLSAQENHERLLLDAVYEIYLAYENRLEQQGDLDFNGLILKVYQLAQSDPSIRRRFDYILVDEFQDTDSGQYRLLETLSEDFKNVTVVCDKKQSIYEWREARLRNVDDFPGETISLDENYRSYGEILNSANFFIGQMMPEESPLKPAADGGRGWSRSNSVNLSRATDIEEEAEYVAREIRHIVHDVKQDPGEIAILMRSVTAAPSFESALKDHDIPYVTIGGRGFYELDEVRDVISLMRLISDPFDDLAMTRILQNALVGLNDAELYYLCNARTDSDPSLYDVLKQSEKHPEDLLSGTRHRLNTLMEAIDELANVRWGLTLGELVSELFKRTDYLKYLAWLEGPRGPRFANVSLLYKTVTLFEEQRPGSCLEDFLSYIDNAMADNSSPASTESKANEVRIMTVHQAKGLEFDVVFIVNVNRGSFPSRFYAAGFGYDDEFGLYVNKFPDGAEGVRYKGGFGTSIEADLKARSIFEENRIMYVAMTRARDILHVTASGPDMGQEHDFFSVLEQYAENVASGIRIAETMRDAIPALAAPEEIRRGADLGELKELATTVVDRVLKRPGIDIPLESTVGFSLSYSRLNLYRFCPMKYTLRYIYNLPLAPHEESFEEIHKNVDAFTLGNLMHKVLMQYHRAKKAGEFINTEQLLRNFARNHPRQTAKAAEKLLKKYLESPISRINTLFEEREFHWSIDTRSRRISINGIVDRVHKEGDSFKILDYKTGKPHPEDHRLQLGIYRLAMESVLGVNGIRTSNYYLSLDEEVEYDFDKGELENIREEVVADALKMAEGDFGFDRVGKMSAGKCDMCGFESFCPKEGSSI